MTIFDILGFVKKVDLILGFDDISVKLAAQFSRLTGCVYTFGECHFGVWWHIGKIGSSFYSSDSLVVTEGVYILLENM